MLSPPAAIPHASAKLKITQMMMVIVAELDYEIYLMDIRTAFHYGMEETRGCSPFNKGTMGMIKCIDMEGCNPVSKSFQGPKLFLYQLNVLPEREDNKHYQPITDFVVCLWQVFTLFVVNHMETALSKHSYSHMGMTKNLCLYLAGSR